MAHFVRATKHRQFEDSETADMTQSAIKHYEQLKRSLRRMRRPRGYQEYYDSYQPEQTAAEEDVDISALRERFVKKVYDDRFTDALPIVYRAYKKYQSEAAAQLGVELEEWADEVFEGTWNVPDNDEKIQALRELLKTPLRVGIDGIDATTKLRPVIGDDELYDAVYDLSQNQGVDADATNLVKKWLYSNMPSVYNKIKSELTQIGRDAQTNWQAPSTPKVDNREYGNTTMDQPVTESDDGLDFIRSLAGLKK